MFVLTFIIEISALGMGPMSDFAHTRMRIFNFNIRMRMFVQNRFFVYVIKFIAKLCLIKCSISTY